MYLLTSKQLLSIYVISAMAALSCSQQNKFRRNKLRYYYEKREKIGRFSREENYKIPPVEKRTRELYPWEKITK